MTVVYTCDDNFVWIMGISMISLFENNKEMKDLDVYLLGDYVSEDNKNVLFGIAKGYGRTCSFIDVPDLNIPKSLTSNRWPKVHLPECSAENLCLLKFIRFSIWIVIL